MPHRPWLAGLGGLCDGGPHVCTRIDEIAFNARIDALLSTGTSQRGFAFVAPYGLSFAIGERVEGGISTSTAVWRQSIRGNNETLWHQAPLRFWVKGLLWPWGKDPHQRFAVLASFEHEARLWRFDGPNQLGLLMDVAALRLSANKPLGLAELGFQLGAIWDWQGRYVALEGGPRLGFHLPFLPDVKVFAEALLRAGPGLSWIRDGEVLPGALGAAGVLPRGGVLSVGIVARPRRQVDLSLVVSVGFGDVAPFALTIRGPLDFSIGKGYPYPQSLVADILRETGRWIAEQLRKLPEPMQETCILYGRDGQPIATLGSLTKDGEYCEFQGQRFRIGDKMYPDPTKRRVCLDPQATHCVAASPSNDATLPAASDLPRSALPGPSPSPGGPPAGRIDPALLRQFLNQGALGPIRGQLDDQCILNEGDQQVSPIGHRSADGKSCVVERDVVNKKTGKKVRTETQQIPVGQSVYRDPTTGRVCIKPNAKSNRDCPVALDPSQNRPLSAGERLGYHGAIGLGNRIEQYQGTAAKGAELLTDPAKLSTTAREAEERAERAAKSAVSTLKDPNRAKEAARQAWNGTVDATQGAWQAAKNWWNKPAEKKLDDLAQAGGGALLDAPVNLATGAVVGGVLRTGEKTLEVGEDMRKAAQAGKRIEGAVDQAKDEVQHQATKGAARGAPTEPYNRRKHYGDTPTAPDRRAVGGESVDHDPPLVQRYYEGDPARGEPPGFQMSDADRRASAKDRDRMQPSTHDAQRRQGGQMSGYSKGKKQEHGL